MALPSWPFVRDHLAIFRRRNRPPGAPPAVPGDGGAAASGFVGGGGSGVSSSVAHQVHGERAREAERKPREGHASDLLHEAASKPPGPQGLCATQMCAAEGSEMSQGCRRSKSNKRCRNKRCLDEVDQAQGWLLRDVVVRLHRRFRV
jgi:hypothetical protein